MREVFVAELVREVLGPREGPREVIPDSPLTEYLTGVLAPLIPHAPNDADADSELPQGSAQEYEDENDDADVLAPPLTLPALDPKSKPASMGITFFARPGQEPALDICVTWARYSRTNGATRSGWSRHPRSYVGTGRLDRGEAVWLDENGAVVQAGHGEVSLERRVRPLPSGVVHVSLYLVNRIPPPSDGRLTSEHHIFQPQIRVNCRSGAVLVPRAEPARDEGEDRLLSFHYSDRPTFARGHICSAIWKDVDPERPFEGRVDFEGITTSSPFSWTDSSLLPASEAARFRWPDVRTEFVPTYSIPAPRLEWPQQYGSPPELSAESLAEMCDPATLAERLSPLSASYERWILELEARVAGLGAGPRGSAEESLEACRDVLRRIRKGIDILQTDEDARLAFCFANKALDVQARWTRPRGLTWWPFQLGFIVMAVESIVNDDSSERDVCDLLWVPTGAGKTEAYLALSSFTAAYRRLKSNRRASGDRTGAGVAILTRYTLRLLTIQQFRRAMATFTACELLRVSNLGQGNRVGWRPRGCRRSEDFLWGTAAFGVGLWVGGEVTPNRMQDLWVRDAQGRRKPIPGAISILEGRKGSGEPAQIVNCPACSALLTVPSKGLRPGSNTIYFVLHCDHPGQLRGNLAAVTGSYGGVRLTPRAPVDLSNPGWIVLPIEFVSRTRLKPEDVEQLWRAVAARLAPAGVALGSAHPARPGYFLRWYDPPGRGGTQRYDFDVYCPNPDCPLAQPWCEALPAGHIHARTAFLSNPDQVVDGVPRLPPGVRLADVQEPFRMGGSNFVSGRTRINAFTVDEQVYRRLPTMVVATVDKFARPAFEPRAASLFGNVTHHHAVFGFYRRFHHSRAVSDEEHPSPTGNRGVPYYVPVPQLDPPDLIIQDELHLVEGPLGSLVGLYETAIEFLCAEGERRRVKYIASTATTRRADDQVRAVFTRRLRIFPPPGLSQSSRFFLEDSENHPLDDSRAGRLYMGICAPGRGPLTPIYRIWARLLQTAHDHRGNPRVDPFRTLTGYFNAIRELGGARALYRQDVQERLPQISPANPRPLSDENAQELSSRTDSTELPVILDLLNQSGPEAQDALFTTSMFGTGVDIPRLGLMVVHGQPKTTSAYIQSTGRVGRSTGGLVVTFLRASRPRDLNHYEFFVGYHRQLHRFVEPVTVYPFAPGAMDRGIGPVAVFIVRNMRQGSDQWSRDPLTIIAGRRAPEALLISHSLEARAQVQPHFRRPGPGETRDLVDSRLDAWREIARRENGDLEYVEYAIGRLPEKPVVLGDAQHRYQGLPEVFHDAPDSLRNVEETTGFQT